MKKTVFLFFAATLLTNASFSQKQGQALIDSLLAELPGAKEDSNKVRLYIDIIAGHVDISSYEGLKYEKPASDLAAKINWRSAIGTIKINIGSIYWRKGNFTEALKYHFDALSLFRNLKNIKKTANALLVIGQDHADAGDYSEALNYFKQSQDLYKETGDSVEVANTYLLFTFVYDCLGNFAESSKQNYQALKLYEAIGNKYGASIALSNLAQCNAKLGNFPEAIKYYREALLVIIGSGDKINECDCHCSIGSVYKTMRNYIEATSSTNRALNIAREINNPGCMAKAYFGMGEIFLEQDKPGEALQNYLLAAELYRKVDNKVELALVLSKTGTIYTRLKMFSEAKKIFDETRSLSDELSSKKIVTDYYRGVELLDSTTADWKNAYFNYKNYVLSRDSIYNQESTKKQTQISMQYEFDKKESATKAEQEKKDIRQRLIRNSITAGLGGALIFLIIVYRQRNKVSQARKRSDELLLNILPAETAEELKKTGTTRAKEFDTVTVMFTDFKNFTLMSEKLTAQELVNEIHYCYSAFDNIITRHGIEKIKTIGDSYMGAGGLRGANNSSAEETVRAALDIRDFIEEEKRKRMAAELPYFEIRIGCNTGPVVAGIVGIKKFAYDIWGNTVNIASRMESSGETGKVNISGNTYELVKEKFNCTYRGKISAKNKGEVDMYFVESIA